MRFYWTGLDWTRLNIEREVGHLGQDCFLKYGFRIATSVFFFPDVLARLQKLIQGLLILCLDATAVLVDIFEA
jgi:hypothetical protein